MIERLRFNRGHWEQMATHVQACAPLEGCGLLAGKQETVERVVLIENAAHSPSRFRMDPAAQLAAFQEFDAQGLDLLGIFHSHPADDLGVIPGPAEPSETDVREAAYPVVNVIWSRRSGVWQARGFWIEDTRITGVALVVGPAE